MFLPFYASTGSVTRPKITQAIVVIVENLVHEEAIYLPLHSLISFKNKNKKKNDENNKIVEVIYIIHYRTELKYMT